MYQPKNSLELKNLTIDDLQSVLRYDEQSIEMLVKMQTQGKTYTELGHEYGMSRQAVQFRMLRLMSTVARLQRHRDNGKQRKD